MKNLIYLLVISFGLWSCGGSGGDDVTPPDPEPTNNKPTNPSNIYPTNNFLCIDNSLTFEWNASTDSDGDNITYQLQVATNNQFNENLQTLSNISLTSTQLSLEKGVAYYWKVKAVDSKNSSSDYSSVFQFYTEGYGALNHLPFSPALVGPSLNAIVQTMSTTLSWTASDVDNNPLVYDVYLDNVNPPISKVSENQSEITLDINLSASTDYFWQVIVKDDKGGVTKGQVWNFKTD
jgi:hypothetical protein